MIKQMIISLDNTQHPSYLRAKVRIHVYINSIIPMHVVVCLLRANNKLLADMTCVYDPALTIRRLDLNQFL